MAVDNNNGQDTVVAESEPSRVEDEEFLKSFTTNQNYLEYMRLVDNALTTRRELLREIMDPRRNINDECGFPETGEIGDSLYRDMYDREPVAARVVELFPNECWKVQPTVFETQDAEQETEFERAFSDLGKSLLSEDSIGGEDGLGEDSLFESDECNPLWEVLHRADILSGIGTYGVILIGLDDGRDLRDPAVPREGQKITFLSTFDKFLVEVGQWETDQNNRRFGKPLSYDIRFDDPRDAGDENVLRPDSTQSHRVHWTRVIHIADGIRGNKVIGTPRMRPVWNNLYNLRKLYHGSAEMFWKGAFFGLALKADKDIVLAGKLPSPQQMRDEMEKYMNGLQRYFGMAGITPESIAPQVEDPTPFIDAQLEAICIKLNWPKRKLLGSERGELSSGQDEDDCNDVIQGRQHGYLTPRVIVPTVDRFIQLGVLPRPQSFGVTWPEVSKMSAETKVAVAVKATEALVKYVQGGAEALITPIDFLTRVMDFSQEEAEEIVEAAMEAMEEQEEDEEQRQLEMQKEMQRQGLEPGQQVPPQDGSEQVVEKAEEIKRR